MTGIEIGRELLSDKVYDMVLAWILDGTLAPGSRVVESEIARRLSLSQAPVREAIKRLVHAGLVTSEPRRGSYVTEISKEEFEIAREMRAGIERAGARSAIESLTVEDVAALRAIVARMEEAVALDDWAAFRKLDMQFHRRVLMIGEHAVLSRLWDSLEPILVSQRAIGDPSFVERRSVVVRWHSDLVEVLEAGDAAAASEAFHLHAMGALDPNLS